MTKSTHSSLVLVLALGLVGCGSAATANAPATTPDRPAAAEPAATTPVVSESSAPDKEESARPLNVELLRSSFKLVVEREPKLTSIFYGHLFADYPESKRLFDGVDLETQGEMLGTALGLVVEHLEDPEWLTETLGTLGENHAGYGVKEKHYQWVGASLLKTLSQVAADDWNDELAQAWGDAYGAIQTLMLARTDA